MTTIDPLERRSGAPRSTLLAAVLLLGAASAIATRSAAIAAGVALLTGRRRRDHRGRAAWTHRVPGRNL